MGSKCGFEAAIDARLLRLSVRRLVGIHDDHHGLEGAATGVVEPDADSAFLVGKPFVLFIGVMAINIGDNDVDVVSGGIGHYVCRRVWLRSMLSLAPCRESSFWNRPGRSRG